MKNGEALETTVLGEGWIFSVFAGLRIPDTHRAVIGAARASGGDGLRALQLAEPPVATRNGLARAARIGASATVDFMPCEQGGLVFPALRPG